jgi:hypothetical protein
MVNNTMTKNSKQYLNFRSFFANSTIIFPPQGIREKNAFVLGRWNLKFSEIMITYKD